MANADAFSSRPVIAPPGQALRFRHIFSVSIFYLELHKVWSWLGL
jgi:hypothetical protein